MESPGMLFFMFAAFLLLLLALEVFLFGTAISTPPHPVVYYISNIIFCSHRKSILIERPIVKTYLSEA